MALVLAVSVPFLATIAWPLSAGQLLSDAQLDAVSAGRVVATASADASATGRHPQTATETATLIRQQSMRSIKLRRIGNNLVVAESANEVETEIGFAKAAAQAAGAAPKVTCHADLRFSQPTTFQLSERQSLTQPGRATCLCSLFGVSVQPN